MALVTLQQVKDYYGLTGSNIEQDDLLENIINHVTQLIKTYTDRDLEQTTYTEYYDGDGTSKLILNQYPVISVTGIWDDTDWEWTDDDKITNYKIIDDQIIVLNDDTFEEGDQNVKVIYTAGYSTIPYDLQLVVITETIRLYKQRRDPDIQAKTLEDGSITRYATDLLPQNKAILNKYKRMIIG